MNDLDYLVSIIIPCYNAELSIGGSIQSAINQTYQNCEIIVVDDGSTDSSWKIINEFGNDVLAVRSSNRGACAARNRGMRLATGSFLQFLDADDLIHFNKIERQMDYLRKNPSDVANCLRHDFTDVATTEGFKHQPPRDTIVMGGIYFLTACRAGKLIGGDDETFVATSAHSKTAAWLVPRFVVNKTGEWDESLMMRQDSDFFERILLNCSKVALITDTCCFYRTSTEGSISKGQSRKHAESYLSQCIKGLDVLNHDNSYWVRVGLLRQFVGFLHRFNGRHPDLEDHCVYQIKTLKVDAGLGWDNRVIAFGVRIFGIKLILKMLRFRRGKILNLGQFLPTGFCE